MKAIIVMMILAVICMLTLGCIFVIDSYDIKSTELAQISNIECSSIARDYFNGILTDDTIDAELQSRVKRVAGDRSEVVANIEYANAEKQIISFNVSMTYKQAGGVDRTIQQKKVYVMERAEYDNSHQFIRCIGAEYRNAGAEAGGFRDDSIWRTQEYKTVLSAVFE